MIRFLGENSKIWSSVFFQWLTTDRIHQFPTLELNCDQQSVFTNSSTVINLETRLASFLKQLVNFSNDATFP
jgi:hypothetical protein